MTKFTPTHRHRKGGLYRLTGAATFAGEYQPREGDVLMVYEGPDGRLWARIRSEFYDGRFETLLPAKDPDT